MLLSAALLVASGFAIGVVGQETQPRKPAATKRTVNGRDPFRKYEPPPPAVKRIAGQATIPSIQDRITLYKAQKQAAMNARMPAPKAVLTDLNGVLDETVSLYSGLFRHIVLERRFADGLPPVRVDAEQIRRVIINLVDNGVEALGGAAAGPRDDGSPPRIELATQHDPVNGVVRITVSDNGPGFNALQDHAFEAFYTTKPAGLGLGLSIARSVVEAHAGIIRAANNRDGGATVSFRLPLVPREHR